MLLLRCLLYLRGVGDRLSCFLDDGKCPFLLFTKIKYINSQSPTSKLKHLDTMWNEKEICVQSLKRMLTFKIYLQLPYAILRVSCMLDLLSYEIFV